MIKLEGIRIGYSDYRKEYYGTVTIMTEEEHKIELRLTQELIDKFIGLCADNIIDVATETASIMKGQLIEQLAPYKIDEQKIIEDKSTNIIGELGVKNNE